MQKNLRAVILSGLDVNGRGPVFQNVVCVLDGGMTGWTPHITWGSMPHAAMSGSSNHDHRSIHRCRDLKDQTSLVYKQTGKDQNSKQISTKLHPQNKIESPAKNLTILDSKIAIDPHN